jgi:glutamine amidotransferase
MDLAGQAANRGFVIATTPLTSTGWQPFQPGELIVFERGELRFSNRRAAPIGR